MSDSAGFFEIKNVHTHNLKGLSVKIPLKVLTVIVGPSGSGKSSLAFDTLARIGMLRLKRLLSYGLPDFSLETIPAELSGKVPPIIALAQGVRDWYPYKSVAELLGLKLLLNQWIARKGEYYCIHCGNYSRYTPPAELLTLYESLPEGTRFYFLLPLLKADRESLRYLYEQGFVRYLVDDKEWEIGEKGYPQGKRVYLLLDRMVKKGGPSGRLYENIRLAKEINGGIVVIRLLSGLEYSFNLRANCITCSQPLLTHLERCEHCRGLGFQGKRNSSEPRGSLCPYCQGLKLKSSILQSKLFGKSIREIFSLPLKEVFPFLLENLDTFDLTKKSLEELWQKITIFKMDYLSLATLVFQLSLGERKTFELFMLFSSELRDTLFILDEPTLGLDLERRMILLQQIKELLKLGNTVLVVEHDPLFIKEADYVIELGFKGKEGGFLLFQGSMADYLREAKTPTSALLRGEEKIKLAKPKELKIIKFKVGPEDIVLKLKGVNVIYGGFDEKGKKFLLELEEKLRSLNYKLFNCAGIFTKRVKEPLLSYLGLWDYLRDLLLILPESRAKGLEKRHFSFHTKEGICSNCQGKGKISLGFEKTEEETLCEECFGKGLNREVLSLSYRGFKIYEMLDLTLGELKNLFIRIPKVQSLCLLVEKAGLSYLQASQRLNELSGGERLRVELLRLLKEGRLPDFLFLAFPLQGLHPKDLEVHFDFFRYLTEKGTTLIVYECNPLIFPFADQLICFEPSLREKTTKVIGEMVEFSP